MKQANVESHKISVEVHVSVADESMIGDKALLDLRVGVGDRNESKYSEEEFVNEVKDGNVIVSMLKDDPIGYMIIKDGVVDELYIEYGFKDSSLEEILREIAILTEV